MNGKDTTRDLLAGLCTAIFAWQVNLSPENQTFSLDLKLPIDDYRGADDLAELQSADPEFLEKNNRVFWLNKLDQSGLQATLPPSIEHLFKLHRTLTWTLQNDQQETVTFRCRPRLLSNDIAPIHQAIVAGLGIGLIPEFLVHLELIRCELVNVLPQWSSPPIPINAIYPSRKYMPQKVRVFLAFLDQKMKER